MKTRRNGDAIAIYCGVMGCETVYADVFSDRALVYSFHYGRHHSTAIHADLFTEICIAAREGMIANVECNCGLLDCATIEAFQVVLESQHAVEISRGKTREMHRNTWRTEELNQIGDLLGLIRDTLPTVEVEVA